MNCKACFLAIATTVTDDSKLQCLTTKVMHWGDGIWLMDLGSFYPYWANKARLKGRDVMALWKLVLQQSLADTPHNETGVIDFQMPYQAVLAENPWRALLTLTYMRQRQLSGFIVHDSELGRNLYRSLPWEVFWREFERLEDHIVATGWRNLTKPKLRQHRLRLNRGLKKLRLPAPAAMEGFNALGVKRRYGEVMSTVWQWMFQDNTIDEHFPWHDWQFQEQRIVKRHLDYTVCHWEELAPFLKDDFDKLCNDNEQELVTELKWCLTLLDLSQVEVVISFRNPHSLNREKGVQTTALLQASYQFAALASRWHIETVQRRESIGIIAWQVELAGQLVLPKIMKDLFGMSCETAGDESVLQQLENQLPIPLRRYDLDEDWLPEGSYHANRFHQPGFATASLQAAAERRPLFLYKKPEVFRDVQENGFSCKENLEYLESSMNKWWLQGRAARERHYYRYTDEKGHAAWVFCDCKGEWFRHGLFG